MRKRITDVRTWREVIRCGDPFEMYRNFMDGKKEIAEINQEYGAYRLHE